MLLVPFLVKVPLDCDKGARIACFDCTAYPSTVANLHRHMSRHKAFIWHAGGVYASDGSLTPCSQGIVWACQVCTALLQQVALTHAYKLDRR